jgi:hypothetical protein
MAVIAPEGTQGNNELVALTGLAASMIAAEAWKTSPLIVSGVGPQLRVYCLYGEAAILGEDGNEDTLSWSPTDGDWRIEFPCPPADLEWVTDAAADISGRVEVVDNSVTKVPEAAGAADSAPTIDATAFLDQ